MQFVFPCDYFKKQLPDELFLDQAEALKSAGHHVFTLDFETLAADSRILPRPSPEPVIYRGFMLDADQYVLLSQALSAQGTSLLIPPQMYLLCHHLPNWYPLLAGMTPETVCFSEPSAALAALPSLGWERYFLKDYVKSLKTGPGSIADSVEQAELILSEIERFRGQLEGGVCLRRVESLQPDSECRYFVFRGQAFGPDPEAALPELVTACLPRITSDFYAVDVALNAEGQARIVEIGDGQVSDLVGWSPERFAGIFSPS